MASSFGVALVVTIFGQSHSDAIGCVIDGLPAGLKVDEEALATFMARRAPGTTSWSTPRKEADKVEILSGLNVGGRTCGAPLACLVRNTDMRSADYEAMARIPRPGHADFTARVKWGGHNDVRGGGQFSGRLTAALCAAGGIALQALAIHGVRVGAHLMQVGGACDEPFACRATDEQSRTVLNRQLDALADGRTFPTISRTAAEAMRREIDAARIDGDSVGGIVECVCCGVPAGIGGPLFGGIESAIARIAFGIPAVKGIEFGAGFEVATMRGSAHNDGFAITADDRASVVTTKNDAGGNLGGITTGMPLLTRLAFKPTPSIALTQRSVDLVNNRGSELAVKGRHDPCIAPRAVPVVEAAVALALLDCWLASPPNDTIDLRP